MPCRLSFSCSTRTAGQEGGKRAGWAGAEGLGSQTGSARPQRVQARLLQAGRRTCEGIKLPWLCTRAGPCSCPGEGTAPRSDWRASQWAYPTPTQHATPPKTPRPPRTSHGVPSGQVARRGRHLGAGAGQRGEAGIQRVHLLLQPLIVTPGAVQLDLQGQAERAQQRVSARGTWAARAFLLLRHPSARCCSITICCCCSHAAAPPLGLA